jgi:leukotriene-A4 hydrolase
VSCYTIESEDKKMEKNADNRVDGGTLSNYTAVVSRQLDLVWSLDFDKKILSGSAAHTVEILAEGGASEVSFDTSAINVQECMVDGEPAAFNLGEQVGVLGQRLSVPLPSAKTAKGCKSVVQIKYVADESASAIQWLDATATKGGVHPYVFTQSQAIHARSLFPCQDCPGVKAPYTAVVTCPSWCTVVMSALADGEAQATPDGKRIFNFTQPVPCSSYLVALAAGDLAKRDLSNRCAVWAEPSVVDAVAFEFSQTEDFLQAAEELTCPYAWGRYDVLCLPPAFPYGGMENPCLTFATPTLIAGDKSLADVVAHEIAHSWTGNLVTCATWEHFWLNEGWTVWLERKIMARIKGGARGGCLDGPAEGLDSLKLSAQMGWKHLSDDVTLLGEDSHFTRLVWPLGQCDPDDAFSGVPYDKGFNLLWYLETLIGSTHFETFAKAYVAKFRDTPLTSEDFRKFFLSFCAEADLSATVASVDWDTWFYTPGLPRPTSTWPDFSNSLSSVAQVLASQWLQASQGPKPLSAASVSTAAGVSESQQNMYFSWSTAQKNIFLEQLLVCKACPSCVCYLHA